MKFGKWFFRIHTAKLLFLKKVDVFFLGGGSAGVRVLFWSRTQNKHVLCIVEKVHLFTCSFLRVLERTALTTVHVAVLFRCRTEIRGAEPLLHFNTTTLSVQLFTTPNIGFTASSQCNQCFLSHPSPKTGCAGVEGAKKFAP